MGQFDRLVATLAVAGLAVGASIALYSSSPKVRAATVATRTSTSSASADNTEQVAATRSILGAATRLGAAIGRERVETTKNLATAYASLAQSQSSLATERVQLAGEQQQINAEVQQITARSAQLTAESTALQREALSLRSARKGATPPLGPGQPGQGDN